MTKKNDSYIQYVSIDLNTKDKRFKHIFYKHIQNFMVKEHFKHLKDTNYLSDNYLNSRQMLKIERKFMKQK